MSNRHRTTRDNVLRDIDQSFAAYDRIDQYLTRSGALFEHQHPKLFTAFCSIMAANKLTRESLQRLRDSI